MTAPTSLTLFLNLDALNHDAQQTWRSYVQQACDAVGIQARIEVFADHPPDSTADFAYLVDSRALTRGLLLNIPHLYIQPSAPPSQSDPFLSGHGTNPPSTDDDDTDSVSQRITLITSCYRGDEYLEGFLSNMAAMTGYDACEHLLIRPASPGNEHSRLVQHVREHPGAVYINLAHDPGLYAVWNLGVILATGRFLSNANLDDRRAPEQLIDLRRVLMARPGVAVASTPLRITTQKNVSWSASRSCPVWPTDITEQEYGPDRLFRETSTGLRSCNLPHCMPLWRRKLHAHVGTFMELRYGPSADWAFWLKAGQHGARFYFGGPASGLSLRHDSSYWRRDPRTREFDQRIVLEFGALSGDAPYVREHAVTPPAAPELAAALDALRGGAILDGIGGLLRVVSGQQPAGDALCRLVDQITWSYLGMRDWRAWVQRYRDGIALEPLPDTALFNALCDLVHGYDPLTLGAAASRVYRHLSLACADWYESFAELDGSLLFALLARRHGHYAVEQHLLTVLHRRDRQQFWTHIQRVYRFIRPLNSLCQAVSAVAVAPAPMTPECDYRLAFYPRYTMNPYQDRLYASLHRQGGLVEGFAAPEPFVALDPLPDKVNILHIHWVNGFFYHKDHPEKRLKRIEHFIAGLIQQKRRGFQLYWTVHNRLSHECCDPPGEIALRQTLYRLVDRVYIHHPLAAELLDWLPDTEKLCLYEHHAMDQVEAVESNSRLAARTALGFTPEDWVLTHIGQVRDYKGLSDALPTLYQVLSESPRMKLVMAGYIKSPEVKAWLAAHPHPRLIVHDAFLSAEELHRYSVASDMGLLAYSTILTSGSLFHWLSCGRPVLATVSGIIGGYLVDGWNGVSYHQQDGLRQRLEFCLNLSSSERDRMGDNALQVAKQLGDPKGADPN